MEKSKRKKKIGFTLLEVLLVIGSLSVLLLIVLLAINPTKNLAEARNTSRERAIDGLWKALEQYTIDSEGYPTTITTSYQEICKTGSSDCTGFVDLSTELVPTYIANIPIDPLTSAGNGTGYEVAINPDNNRVSVRAKNSELNASIVINEVLAVNFLAGDGGTGDDYGTDVIFDASGNSYLVGNFTGTATFGSQNLVSAGNADAYIVKYDTQGNVLWAQRYGSTNYDSADGITIDSSGNVYLTGMFRGTMTMGSYTLTSNASTQDVFVAKVSSSGTVLWAKQAGSNNSDTVVAIGVDSSNNIYITGRFDNGSTITFDTINLVGAGFSDVYVTKYDTNGNVAWARRGGTVAADVAFDIAVDSSGNSYITGYSSGGTSAVFGSVTIPALGNWDTYVVKYDTNGNPQWGRGAGSTNADRGHSIAVDGDGDVYVGGYFVGSVTFGSTINSVGLADSFLVKYNSSGTLQWSRGGWSLNSNFAILESIDVSTGGDVYTTGYFRGGGNFNGQNLTSSGGNDIFVTKYDTNGTISSAERAGGALDDLGNYIKNNGAQCYITGQFRGTATFGTETLISAGGIDTFLWVKDC